MNEWIELPEGVSKERFRTAMNRLLNECFLLKRCKDTQSDYLYILANKDLFGNFLDFLGYELLINEEYGVISLNNPAGTGRIHLSKLDSILLLILRVLYIEKKKELLQTEDIIVLIEEIYDKYQLLKLKQRLRKDILQSVLGKFRRMHLIQNLDRMDGGDMECRLLIYPSILFAIMANSLEEIYAQAQEKLEEYKKGGEDSDGNNDADIEETDED